MWLQKQLASTPPPSESLGVHARLPRLTFGQPSCSGPLLSLRGTVTAADDSTPRPTFTLTIHRIRWLREQIIAVFAFLIYDTALPSGRSRSAKACRTSAPRR